MADRISTRSVWPYYDSSNVQAAASKTKDNTLDKDDFLKILVTQLKNQNPMEPLQDRDFIAQMAQFSSVEQLMNMATEITALRQNLGFASDLIGKQVAWVETAPTGESVMQEGIVESIVIRDGEQYAIVGGHEVKVSSITAMTIAGGDGSDV